MPPEKKPPTDAPLPSLSRNTRLWAAAILLSSLLFSLIWSHYKLFWGDELLEFYSDSKPTIAALISGQLHYPFSLEPPAFHLILHVAQRIIPASLEFSTRILSILSLLVIEICVFHITYRLTRHEAVALVAMMLPFVLPTIDYAPEARVYSLLTALFAVALLCYQLLTDTSSSKSRALPLTGLFLSLATGVLIHYYGIFLPLPILAGEAIRSLRRRKIDWPLCLVIATAFCVFACNLPFMHALAEIRSHYYDTIETDWRMIPYSYRWLLGAHYAVHSFAAHQEVLDFLFNLFFGAAAVGLIIVIGIRWSRISDRTKLPFQIALVTGFALPVIDLFVAHFFTHAYSLRYGLPAVVSASPLLAVFIAPWLGRRRNFIVVMLLLFTSGSLYAIHHINIERGHRAASRAELVLTPALQDAINAQPDHHIYMQDVARFLTSYYYLQPSLQSQLVDIYSIDRELFWMHRDPSSIFARNLHLTTPLPIIPYEVLQRTPGPHILIIYNDPAEEWIDQEVASGIAVAEPKGEAFGGRIYRVTFLSAPQSDATQPGGRKR